MLVVSNNLLVCLLFLVCLMVFLEVNRILKLVLTFVLKKVLFIYLFFQLTVVLLQPWNKYLGIELLTTVHG